MWACATFDFVCVCALQTDSVEKEERDLATRTDAEIEALKCVLVAESRVHCKPQGVVLATVRRCVLTAWCLFRVPVCALCLSRFWCVCAVCRLRVHVLCVCVRVSVSVCRSVCLCSCLPVCLCLSLCCAPCGCVSVPLLRARRCRWIRREYESTKGAVIDLALQVVLNIDNPYASTA